MVKSATQMMLPIVLAAAVACGGGETSGGGAAGQGGVPASAGSVAGSSTPNKVNLDEIFPPGAGRDLVLNNCQNCHTFVPIVVLQMERNAWERSSRDHRERVVKLTDDEFTTLYEYLIANFGPHRPVPMLPKELLETWTSY